MNFTDISLRLNNYPIKEAQRTLVDIQNLSEIEFNLYLKKMKTDIVNFHLNNNGFYSSFVNSTDWNWDSLPIMEKKHIQFPLEQRKYI